jgi:hypothetical protein
MPLGLNALIFKMGIATPVLVVSLQGDCEVQRRHNTFESATLVKGLLCC